MMKMKVKIFKMITLMSWMKVSIVIVKIKLIRRKN